MRAGLSEGRIVSDVSDAEDGIARGVGASAVQGLGERLPGGWTSFARLEQLRR